MPKVTTGSTDDGSVRLDRIEVRTPTGEQLIDPLDLHLPSGDSLVVVGASGVGKTTLLRSLAELWPLRVGHIEQARRRQRDDVPVPIALRATG